MLTLMSNQDDFAQLGSRESQDLCKNCSRLRVDVSMQMEAMTGGVGRRNMLGWGLFVIFCFLFFFFP